MRKYKQVQRKKGKPIDTKRGAGRNIDYNEWEHKRRGMSWKEKIRLEIDGLILKVKMLTSCLPGWKCSAILYGAEKIFRSRLPISSEPCD